MKPADTMTPAEGRRWIHGEMRRTGRPMSYEEIQSLFGVPDWSRTLRHHLNEWVHEGWFEASGAFSTRTFKASNREFRDQRFVPFSAFGRNAPQFSSVWDYAGRAAS